VRLTADKAVRQLLAQVLYVGDATPNEALHRNDGVQGIGGGSVLGGLADFDAIGVIAHGRWQDDLAILIRERLADATAQGSNQRVRGAEIDPDGQTALVWFWTLAGFGDLQ